MENVKFRFIQNVGDYFPSGYFDEDFLNKIKECAGVSADDIKGYADLFTKLRSKYDSYKNEIVNQRCRKKDAIKYTHDFNTELLKVLGYETQNPYERPFVLNDGTCEYVPVRHVLSHNGKVRMLVMEMQNMIPLSSDDEPAGLFNQRYNDEEGMEQVKNTQQRYRISDWEKVFAAPEGYKISPAIINKAISQIFLLEEERRPHFILMLAGNMVFLFNCDKWSRGAYLIFDLDELFSQASLTQNKPYYALFYLLASKNTLAAESEVVLMDTIIEDSYKRAYEVTQDLKKGVVTAVEELANEALYYMKNVAHKPFGKRREDGTYDETDDSFEAEIKDDCLTIVYRLLFIFYAESRSELGILPTNDNVYNLGYSLEMLRDLEQVQLVSQETRDGYFFDDSIKKLFKLIADGHKANEDFYHKSFKIRKVDSPLFDNATLKHLGGVKVRNSVWQKIVCSLSLSFKNKKCGRISYANLGVNQLGSVYESLLAYRGFYAEEDYIEVFAAGKLEEGTFLVPYSRLSAFDVDKEVLKDDDGNIQILPKGSFVYRLNGRDRQKSASYYTPEVLTRSTVKYTLKTILEEVASGKRKAKDLLKLKIMEPAMGAAAFQNEVINQIATAYLTYQRKELEAEGRLKKLIPPDQYQNELQKVKAYIATHNVYGVDLNPTAIELGKLSLWLNVIHKDMQPPFFSNRLALGNAVIGAWLKVYSRSDLDSGKWWEKAPHKVEFGKTKVKRGKNNVYHFLVPDANMLGVRSIKEQKEKYLEQYRRMSGMVGDKQWTKPYTPIEFERMVRISDKVDYLLKEHLNFQLSIENLTDNRVDIWDGLDEEAGQVALDPYSMKVALNEKRYRPTSAYYRLKKVMDYWCALWFWEYADAALLPTREQYLDDIEKMLDVSDDLVRKQVSVADDDSEEIKLKTKEEMLAGDNGQVEMALTMPNNDTDKRYAIVTKYADRYHFFHPMMEFIEVFWLNGGFDIICGNPPWIKLEFDEQGIISEKYPEVAIRKLSAPQIREMRENFFKTSDALRDLYRSEEVEHAGSAAFLNAYCNYPLLEGQQTNLYKCILENGFSLVSDSGFMGMLHPETVYDDPNGKALRKELYLRLRCHFQYENELRLFAEVHHHTKYGDQLYGPRSSSPNFISINNLFHPNTVDACFAHDGSGVCGGIKTEDGRWNTEAHKDRIVTYTEKELRVLSEAFENGADWQSVKLTSVHAKVIIDMLERFSQFPKHVKDFSPIITVDLDETGAVNSGIIKRETFYPKLSDYEMVYNGPQFYVGNPCYKTPRAKCVLNSDYDSIDLQQISEDYIARSNYRPMMPLNEYKKIVDGFEIGQNPDGTAKHDDWIDYYKVGFRKMLSIPGERALICAVLPCRTAHIHGVISASFVRGDNAVDMAALCAAIPMDAYIKIMASQNLTSVRMQSFPLGIDAKYNNAMRSRALLLNCVTNAYTKLWQECWNQAFAQESWSIEDKRLKSFSTLTENWQWSTPLRNYFERRQALVEIDVIASMALGLSLSDLEMIYTIQFPVLQQNENDTWYDANGNVVFTCSKGLVGVGLDRPAWESMRGELSEDGMTYAGTAPTYEHTITKSELYQGQKQTFVAPYTRCDRIADYRRAWAHFEKQFK